ncbi:MAG: hypothetical protein E3J72_17065 [Planctomycetota bacterium]|nr:MAG: hypothetical protein E3J72_17065 [Planctomycetota bacterium]
MRRKFTYGLALLLVLSALVCASGCNILQLVGKGTIGFCASLGSEEPETVECPVCGARFKIDTMHCPVCETTVKGSIRH